MANGLDAGAALGAASLVLSSVALLNGRAPSLPKVANTGPDSGVAADLRLAELSAAGWVIGAGAVGAVIARAKWPLLLSVASVGIAIGVYEAALYWQGRRPSAEA